jgi:TolB-like protein
LISALSDCKELMVRQKRSTNDLIQSRGFAEYASISPDAADIISQRLGAGLFIYSSIEKAGTTLRIDAKLIDTKTKEVLKSFTLGSFSSEENAFKLIDTLSQRLKNFLLISKLINDYPL